MLLQPELEDVCLANRNESLVPKFNDLCRYPVGKPMEPVGKPIDIIKTNKQTNAKSKDIKDDGYSSLSCTYTSNNILVISLGCIGFCMLRQIIF